MFGARKKIIWDEQFVDPPIHYITSVIALLKLRINQLTQKTCTNILYWQQLVILKIVFRL